MTICYYCGLRNPDTLDHTIPVSYYSSEPVRKKRSSYRDRVPIVVSCRECNSTINSKLYFDVRDRAGYIKEKYIKKYKKLLDSPDWDEEDLEDLGWVLRSTVENSIRLKENIQDRLVSLDVLRDLPYDPFIEEKEELGWV